MNARSLNRLVQGRSMSVVLGLLALGAVAWAWLTAPTAVDDAVVAMLPRPLVEGWHWTAAWEPILGVVANIAVAMGIYYVTEHYNLVRGITALPAGLFMLLQGAVPSLMLDAWMSLLPVLVMGGATALFARYDNPGTNRLFALLMAALCAALFLSWAVAWYIPLFIVGMVQMRDLNIKSLLAVVIGLGVPLWLAWVAWPPFFAHCQLPAAASLPPHMIMFMLGLYAVITAMAMLAAYGIGLNRIISYRANIRSMHGFMASLAVVTIVAACVDYTHLAVYLPVLNICAAFQLSHAMADDRLPMVWPVVPLLLVVYTFLYLWQIII